MPSTQALALRALRLRDDIQPYDELRSILSHLLASLGVAADGQITGTAKLNDTPAYLRVTLFDHRNLRPVATTWSDPVTGAYTFTGLSLARKYLVLCDDHEQTHNAAIADWVEATTLI